MLEMLWRADPAPQLARWGDTSWGGNMTLLDLVVQHDSPVHIQHCKARGIEPQDRTWAVALLHENDRPLVCLGLLYEPPASLPLDQRRVRKMISERQARDLEETQVGGDQDTGRARRL